MRVVSCSESQSCKRVQLGSYPRWSSTRTHTFHLGQTFLISWEMSHLSLFKEDSSNCSPPRPLDFHSWHHQLPRHLGQSLSHFWHLPPFTQSPPRPGNPLWPYLISPAVPSQRISPGLLAFISALNVSSYCTARLIARCHSKTFSGSLLPSEQA